MMHYAGQAAMAPVLALPCLPLNRVQAVPEAVQRITVLAYELPA